MLVLTRRYSYCQEFLLILKYMGSDTCPNMEYHCNRVRNHLKQSATSCFSFNMGYTKMCNNYTVCRYNHSK